MTITTTTTTTTADDHAPARSLAQIQSAPLPTVESARRRRRRRRRRASDRRHPPASSAAAATSRKLRDAADQKRANAMRREQAAWPSSDEIVAWWRAKQPARDRERDVQVVVGRPIGMLSDFIVSATRRRSSLVVDTQQTLDDQQPLH